VLLLLLGIHKLLELLLLALMPKIIVNQLAASTLITSVRYGCSSVDALCDVCVLLLLLPGRGSLMAAAAAAAPG
jgi:hypothetical protein